MKIIFFLVITLMACVTVKAQEGLTKEQSDIAIKKAIAERRKVSEAAYGSEWSGRELLNGDYKMKFSYKLFGEKPADGRAMYISMHGGGGAPAAVNTQQWENQKGLYQPTEGLYFVPRSPTDTWNMWHQGYMDGFIEKAIELAVIYEGVNPYKIYIMGYSAGGDGTYQLAPRLADLFAAAAMSAGHPGDAHIENLRNLPFGLYMGGKDYPYDRNKHAQRWDVKLDSLAAADKGAYIHDVRIYPHHGHWMKLEDAVSMKWMPTFTRNPIPTKVIWMQDDVLRGRYYWLHVPTQEQNADGEIVARYEGNKVYIEKSNVGKFYISLNDKMMDLNKPVRVYLGKKLIFKGKVKRYEGNIRSDVAAMRDNDLIFPVKIEVKGSDAQVVEL